MRSDAEVASALARRAMMVGLIETGIEHAKAAVADKPKWGQAHLLLAQATSRGWSCPSGRSNRSAASGKTVRVWSRDVLTREARRSQEDMLFTELIATRMILLNLLKPLAMGQQVTTEDFARISATVRTDTIGKSCRGSHFVNARVSVESRNGVEDENE